jgi:EmrB/QacA subfamily drug resistance transporter
VNKRQLIVLIATILGSAVAIIDGTIVNLALPKIGHSFHVGFSDFQWIVDGYLLSLSALILLGGSLGDILGRKKVYMFGLAGFGASSLLCALAPNAEVLIIVRVVQGVFGALMVPGALSIINTNFPHSLRSQAIGRWTAFSSIAVLLGPPLGGFILDVTSWRWIFFINIPLIILCLILASMGVKESKDSNTRTVDYLGASIAALSLAGVTYGLIQGPTNHWHWSSLVPIFVGVVLIPVFIVCEADRKDPMIHLSLFKSRNFTGSNIMTFAMYGALSGFTFTLAIYLQTKLHYSSLQAGLSFLPVSLLMFFFAGRIGKLSAKYGPRLFMSIGPIIASSGIFLLYFLSPGDKYFLHVLPGALLFAIGMVLTVAPLTTTVMSSVADSSSGIASAINNANARAAGLIIVAVLGLFGANNFYHFSIALSACLALISGLVSLSIIRNVKTN